MGIRRTKQRKCQVGLTILVLMALIAVVSCKGVFQQQSLPGDITNFSGVHVAAPTAIGSATPALMVNSDGLSVLFEVRDAATPVVSVNDGGVLDMKAHAVTNIGAAGTDFSASGGLTLATTLTLSDGDVIVADDVRVTAQTAITVTNGAAFAPTGTYQPIQAAGEVTPTVTIGTAGDLLVLINTSAQTINIADTGTTMLTAAGALGQYDSLTLWCDGTNWIEISRADN